MQKFTALLAVGILMGATSVIAAGDGEGGRFGHRGRHRGQRLDRQAMLEKFDANKNGVLDPEEREAARSARREQHEKRKAEMLAKYDANHNGALDPEEKEALRAEMKSRREELRKQFDADGDGKLNETERKALREHMHQEGGRQH